MDQETSVRIVTCEMHCGGEQLRIVESGLPEIPGGTLLTKRRHLIDRLDHYRRLLMWEPRGHNDAYGCIVMPAVDPGADFSVIFMHHEGYSTMCGHASICLGRYIVERLWRTPVDDGAAQQSVVVPVTIECPCGLVRLFVTRSANRSENGWVKFHSVPASLYKADLLFDVFNVGNLKLDIAYGGAYYAILSASECGIEFGKTPISETVRKAMLIKKHVMAAVPIENADSPDLGFLYGVILTDDRLLDSNNETTNITVFADGEVDRCPTGSGVTARMALMFAKKLVSVDKLITFKSGVNESVFTGKVVNVLDNSVVVEVAGKANFSGKCEFTLEEDDPFQAGFVVS